jgi:hypothetical protein
MQTMSSTVREAFLLGARVASFYDAEEQLVTTGAGPWKLTNSEWFEMSEAVRKVSMFLSTVCGQAPRNPLPSRESMRHFMAHGHGGSFWFTSCGANAVEMSADTLELWVRNLPEYGFADGDSIADACSHSSAELWSYVIIPAIERGEIQTNVWGLPL